MARNKSRPRKGRAGKAKAGAKPNTAHTTASGADAPVIEGNAQETGAHAVKAKKTSPFEFIQQVRSEGSKVTWTSRNETMISTIMVLIMVSVMVLFFFIVDQILRFGVCSILPGNCAGL